MTVYDRYLTGEFTLKILFKYILHVTLFTHKNHMITYIRYTALPTFAERPHKSDAT